MNQSINQSIIKIHHSNLTFVEPPVYPKKEFVKQAVMLFIPKYA
jgi:hypothetical protein